MTISRVGMRAATWDKSAKASSTKCESVIEYGTDMERRKGSVTVKAEDRQRVSGRLRFRHHFSFPPSTGFGRVACACRGGAKRRRDKHAPRLQVIKILSICLLREASITLQNAFFYAILIKTIEI